MDLNGRENVSEEAGQVELSIHALHALLRDLRPYLAEFGMSDSYINGCGTDRRAELSTLQSFHSSHFLLEDKFE